MYFGLLSLCLAQSPLHPLDKRIKVMTWTSPSFLISAQIFISLSQIEQLGMKSRKDVTSFRDFHNNILYPYLFMQMI